MKTSNLFLLLVFLFSTSFIQAQPAIYSESNLVTLGPGSYETYKCALGTTRIWTDSIYTSYAWSTGDTTPLITLNTTGTLTLTVGGGGSSSVVVYQDQLANQNTLYAVPTDEACAGATLELQTFVDPNSWVLWSWGDTVFSDNDCDVQYFPGCGMQKTTSGNYSYIRFNGDNGCYYNSFNQQLSFYPNPVANISQSNDTLFANAGNSHQWFDGNLNPIPNAINAWYVPVQADSYYVQATLDYGLGTCPGPISGGYYWAPNNCVAGYYHFPDTSAQYAVVVVNTSIPAPGQGVSYFWDLGDGNTSTQAFLQHTYLGPGIYTVCVTVSDSSCTDMYCDTIAVTNKVSAPYTINIVAPGALQASVPQTVQNLHIWPQPVEAQLSLQFELQEAHQVEVELMDIHGRKVKRQGTAELRAGVQKIEVDCSGLPAGIYLLQLQAGKEAVSRRISIRN